MTNNFNGLFDELKKAKQGLSEASINAIDSVDAYQNDSGIQELLSVISDDEQECSTYSCT